MEVLHAGLNHYLFISAILISLGLYGMLFRRGTLTLIFSFQVIMSGVNIMLAAFSKFTASGNDGNLLSIALIFCSCIQIITLAVFSLRQLRSGKSGISVQND